MRAHDKRILHSSTEADHRTPLDLFRALDAEFAFTTDVAATAEATLCPTYYGPDHDVLAYRNSLRVAWPSHRAGACWMNNPYSVKLANAYRTGRIKNDEGDWVPHERDEQKACAYEIENWIEKAWLSSYAGSLVVAIVPASIQTTWWHEYIWAGRAETGHRAAEIRCIPHRVQFLKPDGTPNAGVAAVNHAIVVWRPHVAGFREPWTPHVRYWSWK